MFSHTTEIQFIESHLKGTDAQGKEKMSQLMCFKIMSVNFSVSLQISVNNSILLKIVEGNIIVIFA